MMEMERGLQPAQGSRTSVRLAGDWSCRLDPEGVGEAEGWATGFSGEEVQLPGSLDENGIGEPNLRQDDLSGLSRKFVYTGAAWYSRQVVVPEQLAGRALRLFLERVHWASDLWVNGRHVGSNDSLSTPHRYSLGAFEAGTRLQIVLRIDNTVRIPIGRISHALTDWTQTNWNGVVGAMRLEPDAEPTPLDRGSLWSDVHPTGPSGFRTIEARDKQILLNGEPVFLRGTLECCVFPKTGYPPTDLEAWLRVMRRTKEYGLNHIRFHSWCPPEAAFLAADEVGVILQVELPLWTGLWSLSSDQKLLDFCRREAHRILSEYGRHPSFCLFTLGNEMAFYGQEPEVDRLIEELRDAYPDKLYNFSAHGTHLSPACDYYVQADNGKPGPENRPLRGSTWFGVGSRFDRESPSTRTTCDEAASQFDRPVIAHEVAEWAVFPDVHHASRYDGVLEARNFQTIAKMLAENGMDDQSPAFTHSSGKLSAILYKEEIETLLRTEGIAGYQLLGLTDFPGQGSATIGMLDAFWNEKGFIDGARFREFCSETVPLFANDRVVWQQGETLKGTASVHHSGGNASPGLQWTLRDRSGASVRTGNFPDQPLVSGKRTVFGEVQINLQDLPAPERYELVLEAGNLGRNRWSFWIYPNRVVLADLTGVEVFPHYRNDVRRALQRGAKVWLRIDPNRTWSGIPGRFAPAFWSPIHFKEQVGTMGTLIQNEHPVFKEFPTDGHTDWQWWDALVRSKAAILNELPKEYRPILQVIDRYERNHKLGTLFEARVGSGRLFVSLIGFDAVQSPVLRQLETSIHRYLASDDFNPSQSLRLRDLDLLFAAEP